MYKPPDTMLTLSFREAAVTLHVERLLTVLYFNVMTKNSSATVTFITKANF